MKTKSLFKKLGLVATVAAVAVTSVFGLTACDKKDTEFKANLLTGVETEKYAFCVKEGNTTLKAELDEFFNKETTKVAVQTSLAFHNGESKTTIEYPDLSDNTGKTITMVTEAGFAPYEYTVTEGVGSIGTVGGVDVELMMLFCESKNYKLEMKDVNFDTIPAEVNKSDTNVGAAGMTITAEREEVVDFAVPYIETKQYVISGASKDFKDIKELKDKKIGVQDGTTGNMLVENAMKGTEDGGTGELVSDKTKLTTYKKVSVAFQDLVNGKLDAIVIDEFVEIVLVDN